MQAVPLFRISGWSRFIGGFQCSTVSRRAQLLGPAKQFTYPLLSSLTKTEITHQVVRDLWAYFGSWENLRDASIVEIEDTIRAVTLLERNVVQLKQALEQITQRCGTLSLDFLHDYHTDKIRSWLELDAPPLVDLLSIGPTSPAERAC